MPVAVPAGAKRVRPQQRITVTVRTLVDLSATDLVLRLTYIGDDGKTYPQVAPIRTATATWAPVSIGVLNPPCNGWLIHAAISGTGISTLDAGPAGWLWLGMFAGNDPTGLQIEWQIASLLKGSLLTWSAGDADAHPGFWPDSPSKWLAYRATIVNGAGGAGNQSYTFTPGIGGRFRIHNLQLMNGDTVARNGQANIQRASDNIVGLADAGPGVGANIAAGAWQGYPSQGAFAVPYTGGAGQRYPWVVGDAELVVTLAAVALSQNSECLALLEFWGPPPSVLEAGASTPTITVEQEAVLFG
jgi:hypothetical protein